jgi:hypothetical protein
MIEEIGLLLIFLTSINLLVNISRWYIEGKKAPPLTYLELLMASDFTKSGDVTTRDLERMLDENSEDLKLFIFEEIRKDTKRGFDAKIKSNEE